MKVTFRSWGLCPWHVTPLFLWVVIAQGFLTGCSGSPRRAPQPLQEPGEGIAVLSQPAGAEIWMDGEPMPMRTGSLTGPPLFITRPDRSDPHLLTVRMRGYHDWNQWIEWTGEGGVVVRAILVPASEPPIRLKVLSDPSGASLWLNGHNTGRQTPVELTIPPSAHALRLERSGYLPANETIFPVGRQVGEIFVPLTPSDRGMIVGTVYDRYGNGLFGATVEAADDSGTVVATSRTGPFGSFSLGFLRFGTYRLRAVATVQGVEEVGLQDSVEVTPGGRTVESLVLVASDLTGTVQGRVENERGEPIPDALVTSLFYALGTDWVLASRKTKTDPNGRFVMERLPAGPIVLTAIKEGYQKERVSFLLNQSEVRSALFIMQPVSRPPRPNPPQALFAIAEILPATTPQVAGSRVVVERNFYHTLLRNRLIRFHRLYRKTKPALNRWSQRYFPVGFWGQVEVGWGVRGESVSGYQIYRSQTESSGWQLRAKVSEPEQSLFADPHYDFRQDTEYAYAIRSIGLNGSLSDLSNVVEARFLSPVRSVRPLPDATVSVRQLTFEWDSLSGIPVYTVEIFSDLESILVGDPVWSKVTDRKDAVYDGPPLMEGRTYYWIVIGQNDPDWQKARSFSVSELRRFTVISE